MWKHLDNTNGGPDDADGLSTSSLDVGAARPICCSPLPLPATSSQFPSSGTTTSVLVGGSFVLQLKGCSGSSKGVQDLADPNNETCPYLVCFGVFLCLC